MPFNTIAAIGAAAALIAAPPPEGVVTASPVTAEAALVADAPNGIARARIRWALSRRVARDQAARRDYLALAARKDRASVRAALEAARAEVRRTDAENTAALRGLTDRYGWFPTDKWDWPTANFAWLIVQHADADPEFQARVLATMTPLAASGRVPIHHYANLYDRVAKNYGIPQRFGTQGRCTAPGVWTPLPLEDPAALDRLREAAGLGDMAAYAAKTSARCGAADPAPGPAPDSAPDA